MLCGTNKTASAIVPIAPSVVVIPASAALSGSHSAHVDRRLDSIPIVVGVPCADPERHIRPGGRAPATNSLSVVIAGLDPATQWPCGEDRSKVLIECNHRHSPTPFRSARPLRHRLEAGDDGREAESPDGHRVCRTGQLRPNDGIQPSARERVHGRTAPPGARSAVTWRPASPRWTRRPSPCRPLDPRLREDDGYGEGVGGRAACPHSFSSTAAAPDTVAEPGASSTSSEVTTPSSTIMA